MLLRTAVLNVIFLGASSVAFAQAGGGSGTPQEQDACRPDVRRFCSKVDPNGGDDAFLACLENNRDRLSKACLGVLIDHGR
jgi:hypothetical protein